jgi:hypothetical protein
MITNAKPSLFEQLETCFLSDRSRRIRQNLQEKNQDTSGRSSPILWAEGLWGKLIQRGISQDRSQLLKSLDVVEIDNSLDNPILVMGDKFESFPNPSERKAVSEKKPGRNPTLG